MLCMVEVCKRFLPKLKHKREFLTFFVFRLTEKLLLPILTIGLQFNFYQINFIL